jgi:hypothetical protein
MLKKVDKGIKNIIYRANKISQLYVFIFSRDYFRFVQKTVIIHRTAGTVGAVL